MKIIIGSVDSPSTDAQSKKYYGDVMGMQISVAVLILTFAPPLAAICKLRVKQLLQSKNIALKEFYFEDYYVY